MFDIGNGQRGGNKEKMGKCEERISLHFLILSSFPLHFLFSSSHSFLFLFIFSFSLHFLASRMQGYSKLCNPEERIKIEQACHFRSGRLELRNPLHATSRFFCHFKSGGKQFSSLEIRIKCTKNHGFLCLAQLIVSLY